MEIKTFRDILNRVLLANEFVKRKSYYCKIANEVICVIGIQRSSFSNSYYINIGFMIVELHPAPSELKDVYGEIRCRFSSFETGNDAFDLDLIRENDIDKLIDCIKINLEHYVNGYLSIDGLRELLSLNPKLLYETTIKGKSVLLNTNE